MKSNGSGEKSSSGLVILALVPFQAAAQAWQQSMTPATDAAQQKMLLFFMPVMMFLMIGLVFFVSIRQQRKRDKERRLLLESLKSGDRVVFSDQVGALREAIEAAHPSSFART